MNKLLEKIENFDEKTDNEYNQSAAKAPAPTPNMSLLMYVSNLVEYPPNEKNSHAAAVTNSELLTSQCCPN